MGKKKFLDKKKAATFVLMHRDTEGADDDVSARVFTRVDGGFGPVPGFSEEDPRTNPDYGYETDDGEEEEEEDGVEESSVFADAEEDDDVRSRRSAAPSRASTRRSTASRAAQHKGPLPEHVRVELIELGFPDDGYDYMQHMRKIGVSGVGGSFVPTTRPKPEKLRADVKVFDASKVAVKLVEEEASDKKIIAAVGSSSVHQMRRPAYVEHGLDSEVAAALENSEGSEFDSADELDDDFVVFANNNPEGSTSASNLRLDSSVVEADEEEDEEEFSDEDARSGVTVENEPPRPSRLLDEQFEKLALREYADDDDEFDDEEEGPEAAGGRGDDMSRFEGMLSEYLSDPKVMGDKYMTPAEIERQCGGVSVSKPVEALEHSDDDGLVVIEVESEDERSNWDCESVVSTLSNLDNHPGKISAPSGKPRRKALPSLGKVLEDKEMNGGIIKLRGKQSLPTDFLPLRPGAEKAKQIKSAAKASETTKAKPVSRAGETPEERKARKTAVKEERREARASKKALKILYKDESQRAQHGAANTGASGIHLP